MKIMVCYDGSEASQAALKVAAQYAEQFSASVDVVTMLPGGAESGQGASAEYRTLRKGLEELAATTEGTTINCVEEVVGHDETDGEHLVGYATREGVDAVFIGVKKVSKVGKLLFGSTAQFVILSAPCPVISVKARTV